MRPGLAPELAASRPPFAATRHTNEVRVNLTSEHILDMIVAIADTGQLKSSLEAALDGLRP